MDKLSVHRAAVEKCLREWHEYANRGQPSVGVVSDLIFDAAGGNYLIVNTGWQDGRRVRGIEAHVRIRDGKVWVEEDWTKWGLADELMKAGVPAADIVLAFHPPHLRPLTAFAPA